MNLIAHGKVYTGEESNKLFGTGYFYRGESKTLSLNCGSIRSQAKRNNLTVLLSEHDIDNILGCESHIDESYFSSELLPPSYTIIRKDRYLSGGGGFIGARRSLTVSEDLKL